MTVYIIPVGINNSRYIKDNILEYISEKKISKIGRKYFYLEGSDDPYNISNLKHDCKHHFDTQAFLDKQDILDKAEFEELKDKIKIKFNTRAEIDLSLEQLREINRIISGAIGSI